MMYDEITTALDESRMFEALTVAVDEAPTFEAKVRIVERLSITSSEGAADLYVSVWYGVEGFNLFKVGYDDGEPTTIQVIGGNVTYYL